MEMFVSKRGNKEDNVKFAQADYWGFGGKRKYKAIIQKNLLTGEERVFFHRRINGETKVVYKNSPFGMLKVTGYTTLPLVYSNLRHAIPVYFNEQVMWDGKPCEHELFA